MKVGATTAIDEEDDLRQPGPYCAARELALQAEAAGFESISLHDYQFFRFANPPQFGVLESWAVLTGLAEATTLGEIGAVVMCVPSARYFDQELALRGTASKIAAGFQGSRARDVHHVIYNLIPNSSSALAQRSEALAIYQRGHGPTLPDTTKP